MMDKKKFGDEKFIYAMALKDVFESQEKEAQDKRNQAITVSDTIVIGGISYGFKTKRIFDGNVSVIIPDKFGIMNEEAAIKKYPSEHRPPYIFTNADGSINIVFNLLDHPPEMNQIGENICEWKMLIQQASPTCVFLTVKNKALDAANIGYFEYKNDAEDGAVYNLIFTVGTLSKPLLGAFNCPFEQYEDWRQLAVQIVLSIQDTTMDKGKTEQKKIKREVKSLIF